MAENFTNLYVSHSDSRTYETLCSIFETLNDDPMPDEDNIESTLKRKSESILPGAGLQLAQDLIDSNKKHSNGGQENLMPESKALVEGYCVYSFVHGSSGPEIIEAVIKFVGSMFSGVDVRAWLYGDEDPGEEMFRLEKGRVVIKEYAPEHKERDNDSLPKEYQWWHDGLPSGISEGFINDWKEIDDDDWNDEAIDDQDLDEDLDQDLDEYEDDEGSEDVFKNLEDVFKKLVGRPRDLPSEITGKVWLTSRTESGLIIRPKWDDDAILDDMSQVQHGDFVHARVKSKDKATGLLQCTLIERTPKKDISYVDPLHDLSSEITGKVWVTPRTECGLIIKTSGNLPDALLDDMSQVQQGDFVRVRIHSKDELTDILQCTLIERTPKIK